LELTGSRGIESTSKSKIGAPVHPNPPQSNVGEYTARDEKEFSLEGSLESIAAEARANVGECTSREQRECFLESIAAAETRAVVPAGSYHVSFSLDHLGFCFV